MSPGTLRASSRTCWSLPKKDEGLDAAREEKSRGRTVVVRSIMNDKSDTAVGDLE